MEQATGKAGAGIGDAGIVSGSKPLDLSRRSPETLARWACELNVFRWPKDFPIAKPEGWDLWTSDRDRRKDRLYSDLKSRFPEFAVATDAVRRAADFDRVMAYWRDRFSGNESPPPISPRLGLQAKRKAEEFVALMGPKLKAQWEGGMSLGEIRDQLNAEGQLTYRGSRWNKMQIKRILNALSVDTSENRNRSREMEQETARIGCDILEAARRVGDGYGYRRMEKELKKMGIRNRYGRPLCRSTIELILKRLGEKK